MTARSSDFSLSVERLLNICGQLRKICRDAKISISRDFERDIITQLEHFDLIVYGKFNAGKSSLLNLLIPPDLANYRLPRDSEPTTKILWRIGFAEQPFLCGKRFGEDEPSTCGFESIDAMLQYLEEDRGKHKGVITCADYLDIQLPFPLGERTGWFFWDTRGRGDVEGTEKENEKNEKACSIIRNASEGLILVTNTEGKGDLVHYLEEFKASPPTCLIVVLSNSGVLSDDPDTFHEEAKSNLEKIESRLRKSSLFESIPFIRFVAVDSRIVRNALDACSDHRGEIDKTIENWSAGMSRSSDSFLAALERRPGEARIIEKGGLFNLGSILEEVRQVEEPILLIKALEKVHSKINGSLESNRESIDEIKDQIKKLSSEIKTVEAKIKQQLTCPTSRELCGIVQDQTKNTVERKANMFRDDVALRILSMELEASEAPSLKKFIGSIGRSLGVGIWDDHERFMSAIFPKLQDAANDFVKDNLWKYFYENTILWASELTNDSVAKYRRSVAIDSNFPSRKKFTIETIEYSGIEKKPTEDVIELLLEPSVEKIQASLSDQDILDSKKVQSKFTTLIGKEASAVSNRVIRLMSDDLIIQIRQVLQKMRDAVRAVLQKEIDKKTDMLLSMHEQRDVMTSYRTKLNRLKVEVEKFKEIQKKNIRRISSNHPTHETH